MRSVRFSWTSCLLLLSSVVGAAETPDYDTQVAPLLTKYCAGCHNREDAEGELALDTFAGLTKGGETGAVVTPGVSESSRLIGVLTGRLEPLMPPEDEEAPTQEEIALLAAWIEGGAKGPSGENPNRRRLITPSYPPVDTPPAITSIAFSPEGKTLAIARFGQVELKQLDDETAKPMLLEHPGKVQSVRFSKEGKSLLTATGVTGLYGEARLWNVADATLQKTFPAKGGEGHHDIVYAAAISPDGRLVATAGYDRKILLWEVESSKLIRTLAGHNGAVFDLAFSSDGNLLASASADTTIKIWHVESGQRLDTRSEPLKEQTTTAISPDGTRFVGSGEDSRIRVWQLIATDKPKNNPLLLTRFAHEGAIYLLRFSDDGNRLVSAGMDGEVKLWETESFRQIHSWPNQPASVQAVAISSKAGQVAVGRMDGSVELYPLPGGLGHGSHALAKSEKQNSVPEPTGVEGQVIESEPNDSPQEAVAIEAPARIRGVIHSQASNSSTEPQSADVDYFRFSSLAGQRWIIEVLAARNKSSLDSHIEILDSTGRSIPRVTLQATIDSYFTFRGKNSFQESDFRLHNWREMHLNQYLYCNGEVVKFYHYPRGPDSGFFVYARGRTRRSYFDTTPLTHALNEPCYIVEPHPPGTPIVPNGLPTFVVNYENDDDSLRRFGSDSFLTFTAPQQGEYLVRLKDVRGLDNNDFRYELILRAPKPDFGIQTLTKKGVSIVAGSGRKFGVVLDRKDGFDGPVTVHVEGLPAGFTTDSPLLITSGQLHAWGTIHAAKDAVAPSEKEANSAKLIAVAHVNGREVRKWPQDLGKILLNPKGSLKVALIPTQTNPPTKGQMPVLEITAGTTISFLIRVERNGYQGSVSFGKQDAAINVPHGIYVDHIGLNGLQIQENETERNVSLTAEPWVEPQERIIFVEASEAGKPTSSPVLLRVLRSKTNVASR